MFNALRMPQLDIFSWLNQVLFTIVMIFTFYVLLILVFLPVTTGIFKGRNKLQSARALSINLLNKQFVTYMYDTTKTLTTIFLNNLIIVWQYFLPSNTAALQNEINTTCYNNSAVELQNAYLNNALVNLLATSLVKQDKEVSEDEVLLEGVEFENMVKPTANTINEELFQQLLKNIEEVEAKN